MVVRAVEKLRFAPRDLVITILAEHEGRFDATRGLAAAFGHEVTTVVLDEPTKSQSETIAKTIELLNLREPFFVKDADNSFEIDTMESETNYVTVSSLNNFDLINARNKSYVRVDDNNFITSIREKLVISDTFSVGGYFFRDPKVFLDAFKKLSISPLRPPTELYISEIIAHLLSNGELFKIRVAKNFEDWGTIQEWRRKLESRRTFFVSIDGVLFARGSRYFSPGYDDVHSNAAAIKAIQALADAGHQLIYLSVRPAELCELTRKAIADEGLPDARLIMECTSSQWTLVTSPDPTMPFATSRACEILPEDTRSVEKLGWLN